MPPLRAGQETEVGLLLRNGKRFLPTYALWFEFAARPFERGEPARPESTITARGIDVWAALSRVPEAGARGTVHLRTRLDPGGEGEARLGIHAGAPGPPQDRAPRYRIALPVRVPEQADGHRPPQGGAGLAGSCGIPALRSGAGPGAPPASSSQTRAGDEGDMMALRRYEPGDSHRLIHWKASARMGRLLIRQFSAQSSEACSIWLVTDAAVWTRPDQFELLMSLAATLAQDLFRAGRLQAAAIDAGPRVAMRRVADLESFLDRLAEARPQPAARDAAAMAEERWRQGVNVLTFGARRRQGRRGIHQWKQGGRDLVPTSSSS